MRLFGMQIMTRTDNETKNRNASVYIVNTVRAAL